MGLSKEETESLSQTFEKHFDSIEKRLDRIDKILDDNFYDINLMVDALNRRKENSSEYEIDTSGYDGWFK